MLSIIVSNSHFWKWLGARDMTIFGVHVGPRIPNIGYFKVFQGIRGFQGIWGYTGAYEVNGSIMGYMVVTPSLSPASLLSVPPDPPPPPPSFSQIARYTFTFCSLFMICYHVHDLQ